MRKVIMCVIYALMLKLSMVMLCTDVVSGMIGRIGGGPQRC